MARNIGRIGVSSRSLKFALLWVLTLSRRKQGSSPLGSAKNIKSLALTPGRVALHCPVTVPAAFMPGSETAGARSGTVVGDRQGQQFAAIRTLRPCRLWRHLRDAVARFNRLSAGTSHIGFPAAARLSLPCQNRLRLPRFLPMTRRSQTATLALAVGG